MPVHLFTDGIEPVTPNALVWQFLDTREFEDLRGADMCEMSSPMNGSGVGEPCIYCGSTKPPSKREHVMSRALGTFEQNWTLDCVCDDCNKPGFPISSWYPTRRTIRRALISRVLTRENPTRKGDTRWVKKKSSRFSSPSTAC